MPQKKRQSLLRRFHDGEIPILVATDVVARGVDITLDQYPYPAGSTGLTVQFPRWSRDGGDAKLAERVRDS